MMEDEICETKELWQLAFEASEDGICDWNIARNVIFFTDRWREMVGCRDLDFSHIFQEWEDRIHPDDVELTVRDMNSYHKGEISTFRNKHRLLCHNAYRWMLCRGKIVRLDGNGKPARVIYTFTDISEFEEAMAALVEVLRKEKEQNEFKMQLVSMASHEFRTPLSTILIITDALDTYLEKMTRDEIGRKLQLIKKNVLFLKDIMEKVLNLAQIDAGKMVFSPVVTEMNDFVAGIIAEMQEQHDYANEIEYHKHELPVLARIDRYMMKLSILNIISNAIKYSPAGSPVVADISCKGPNLLIHISDHGIGIPDEDAKQIFDPFHRGSNTGNIRGSGLGLFFVLKFVKYHGGTVSFISERKRGTTFTLQIPYMENTPSAE